MRRSVTGRQSSRPLWRRNSGEAERAKSAVAGMSTRRIFGCTAIGDISIVRSIAMAPWSTSYSASTATSPQPVSALLSIGEGGYRCDPRPGHDERPRCGIAGASGLVQLTGAALHLGATAATHVLRAAKLT